MRKRQVVGENAVKMGLVIMFPSPDAAGIIQRSVRWKGAHLKHWRNKKSYKVFSPKT
jgi:hypothetical protein